ncbi:MAG: tryptophan--tRNA ligase [Candidatus Methanoperedenaceae archaeon]|nr:tryptophan--tRNA ligase [Candidatus Methanoperedenaceae archaeon]
MTTIDPWGAVKIDNYSKLFDEFGISRFDELLVKIKNPHRYMRRNVIFGHRSYESVLDAMLSGKPFAAMSGFMPSGQVHLGHKMVMEEIIWHQQQGGDAFLAIADMEAHSVRGKSWKECDTLGKDYILSAFALGFEPGEHGHIYFQSKSAQVKDLSFELGIKTNFSELSAIYGFNGETNIAHMVSAVTQSADILQPQLKEFGGPKPVVIPVGADQDPHIRLTRGLADKMNMFHVFPGPPRHPNFKGMINIYSKSPTSDTMKTENEFNILKNRLLQEKIVSKAGIKFDDTEDSMNCYTGHIEIACIKSSPEELLPKVQESTRAVALELGGYAFMPPASTYHKFMTGLYGGKMSSSVPDSFIGLTEEPQAGAKKVMHAMTGGRVTLQEQQKLGGEPEKCSVYELLLFHLVDDDNELVEVYKDCEGGTRVCGNCKKYAAGLMEEFLRCHQKKRELAKEKLAGLGF